MAIGKDGQNVRLTAKLTGFRIEVEGNGEVSAPEEKVEEPAPVEPAHARLRLKNYQKRKPKKISQRRAKEASPKQNN